MMMGFLALLAQEDESLYLGSNACTTCHKKQSRGAQSLQWAKTAHAQAYETLMSDKALEIARERSLEKPPQESAECLICHTVGFGNGGFEVKDEAFWNPAEDDPVARKAAKRMHNLKGVGCESCHGPGREYADKRRMRSLYERNVEYEYYGLAVVNEEVCLTCHNAESPTFRPLDYEAALKEVSHPFPPNLSHEDDEP